jgi:hypothetical protein
MGRNQTEKETVGERQSEGDKEEHRGSATKPPTLALFKCSQLALFFCSVPHDDTGDKEVTRKRPFEAGKAVLEDGEVGSDRLAE